MESQTRNLNARGGQEIPSPPIPTLQRPPAGNPRFSAENQHFQMPEATNATFCNVFRSLYHIRATITGMREWTKINKRLPMLNL
jgi:hypothetical protein